MGLGYDLVVSILSFYSDDPSLNRIDVYNFMYNVALIAYDSDAIGPTRKTHLAKVKLKLWSTVYSLTG